jgi:hypothetical protein
MPFDMQAVIREQAAHLLCMAGDPAYRDHAKKRRDEMLADPMWAGLREELDRQQAEAAAKPKEPAHG